MASSTRRHVRHMSKQDDDGDNSTIPPPNISSIKNKFKRAETFVKIKREKRKQRIEERKVRRREAELLGDEAPPKQVPRTIENTREADETMVTQDDEEVQYDEANDELASYFKRESLPKILITTSDRPRTKTNKFVQELKMAIPNSQSKYRRGLDLKKIIPQAIAKSFTDLIVIHEDRGEPNALYVCHLPEGPTAHFKLSSVKLRKDIKRVGKPCSNQPEIVLNNFNTRLGHSIGRQLAALFPHDPEFRGRKLVTFHNQRDFVFFRHHRYEFKSGEKAAMQELGPRFTLKLKSLQKGTFDSKYGEYEWILKRHEMETSRRRFFL
ncbi:PREDICTED: ribosome production factor 1-like [Priapulus caudatus]|uniref:Ribosome production factor 1-like n=1 Tax=Priapulus caudatus TaxID=37621 RepID=A0ABM1DQM2_PRICU|nr:PREDICTED: ribosome production factor 1-like [Priapulus caudatus]